MFDSVTQAREAKHHCDILLYLNTHFSSVTKPDCFPPKQALVYASLLTSSVSKSLLEKPDAIMGTLKSSNTTVLHVSAQK